jgi:hypothetical protein
MHWDELVPRIKYLLKIERAPDMLIVHCGGNNLGYHYLHKLRLQIKASLNRVQKMLPHNHPAKLLILAAARLSVLAGPPR